MTLAHCLPPVLPITNHHNTDTLPTTCPTNHLPPQHWHTAETYPTNHLLPWHLHTAYHLSYQSPTTTTLAHCLLPVLPITYHHDTATLLTPVLPITYHNNTDTLLTPVLPITYYHDTCTLPTTCRTNHIPPRHWHTAYYLSYQSQTNITLAHCLPPVLPITYHHDTGTVPANAAAHAFVGSRLDAGNNFIWYCSTPISTHSKNTEHCR